MSWGKNLKMPYKRSGPLCTIPWEFKEWFAAHKIYVNDAQYGRWVHIDDRKVRHNENPKFNDVWEDFIYDANGNQLRRSKDEILAKLDEIRAAYQPTPP
jgi:hypothetical protein